MTFVARRKAIGVFVGFIVLVVAYATLARHIYGGDSDVATLVLQGQAVAKGHVTLHGWWFLLDSFWTVEVPMYALGYELFGVRPELLYVVPAVFAALVIISAIFLARIGQTRRGGWIAAVAVFALIGLPSNWWALLFLRGGWHVATTLYCMVAFACLYRSGSRWRWAVGVALLALGQVGDLQTIVLGTAPILAAGLVAMARTRDWRAGTWQVAAAVAAPIAGVIIRALSIAVGAYRIGGANPHASASEMVANVQRLPDWLGLAFGSATDHSNTLGGPVAIAALRTVAVVIVAIAVVVALALLVRAALIGENAHPATVPGADASAQVADVSAQAADEPHWRVDDVLALACAADVVFYMYATLANDKGYLRYLTPFVILGSTLAARTIARRAASLNWTKRSARAVLALAGIVTALWAGGFAHDLTRHEPHLIGSPLAAALRAHHLNLGLGYYWVANATTVTSSDHVVIRPVRADAAQRIVRRDQLSSDLWYGKPFQFLVLDWQQPFENVTVGTATLTFGPPAETFRVGSSEVLVWSHPITVGP